MELRSFAERILTSPAIEDKLRPIEPPITDADPGPPVRPELPARPLELQFAARRNAPPMPHPNTFEEPERRGLAHHIMANHELQALEVMAFTLLAFPEAPADFRRGLAEVMADEQRHTRMHIERAAALGVPFGTRPVNGYFWLKAQEFRSLLEYLAGLPLTFEGGNLDHTLEFEQHFAAVGDLRGAALMRRIHHDEIEHVRFGLDWLRRLKPPEQSEWDAYTTHLHYPLRPEKSRGRKLYAAPRRAAGMTGEFIARLAEWGPVAPENETSTEGERGA